VYATQQAHGSGCSTYGALCFSGELVSLYCFGSLREVLLRLRRKYQVGRYQGAIQNTEEEWTEKFIHITKIVRMHTDYLYDPSPAYTLNQVFVHHLWQAEDEARALYVLHPVSAAQRDATKRPDETASS
jgi:hypothetical protein